VEIGVNPFTRKKVYDTESKKEEPKKEKEEPKKEEPTENAEVTAPDTAHPKKKSMKEILELKDKRISELKQEKERIRKEKLEENKVLRLRIEDAEKVGNAAAAEVLRLRISDNNQQMDFSRKEFFTSAIDQIDDYNMKRYEELIDFYGAKVDSIELDNALKSVDNYHATLYCLLNYIDQYPNAMKEWEGYSPMRKVDFIKDLSTGIKRIRTNEDKKMEQATTQPSKEPAKEIPKAVEAEPQGSTGEAPKIAKGGIKSRKDWESKLRHYSKYGEGGFN